MSIFKRSAKAVARRCRGLMRQALDARRLREAIGRGPVRIIVGPSGTAQDGWIATDIEYLNLLRPADWEKFFEKNTSSRHSCGACMGAPDGRAGASGCKDML